MREVFLQEALFELSEPKPTHFHYATGSTTVKVGMTVKGIAARMKRDKQFRGHKVIFEAPAPPDCEMHRGPGRTYCDWEQQWERAHADDRLPNGEHYRPSDYVLEALLFASARDVKARAAIDWMRRYRMGQTA